MADDDIDIEGEFDFKTEVGDGLYDTNELPSKSANLLPEFTNPPWMLEQSLDRAETEEECKQSVSLKGWSLDNCVDEKSKATIEKMLLEEQQYLNGRKKGKYLGISKSVLLVTSSQSQLEPQGKRQWTDEEKKLFLRGLELYGRSWSKVAQLIPSRTPMQVKNYAQQYMKNMAKRAEQIVSEVTEVPDTLSSHGATAAINFNSISASEAAVTTGQPTITTLPHHPTGTAIRRKNKIKSHRARQSHLPDSRLPEVINDRAVNSLSSSGSSVVKHSSKHPPQNCPNINKLSGHCVSSITKHRTVVASHKDTKQVTKDNSGPTSAVIQNREDSEDEEIDIDIENDDGDENAILQSRSTSPSSVYSRLLQQANVQPPDAADQSNGNNHCLGESKGDGTPMCENFFSEELKTCSLPEDSDNSLPQTNDANETPSSAKLDPGSNDNSTENEDELLEEEALSRQDLKPVENGIVSSNGELFEFPIPTEEKFLAPNTILEEEKMVHSEFFDGRPLKTPERYLRIRNYILDCWKKTCPNYLNKTSVRPGLKNCGDVNCIGRIHAYLECIGAINFGCDQAAYNNLSRSVTLLGKPKHTGKEMKQMLSAAKLEAMRPRKRRIRDSSGLWVNEKELEGKTIEHKPEKEGTGLGKTVRTPKVTYDPFKLVPCQFFTEENQAPFTLEVFSTALAVMDIHAHISRTEVIGMLGGQYNKATSHLTISMAVPCKSISTGMQCEMDPVSQTLASEQIEDVGMQVVGWYHSHPTFTPNPSVRDIETQQKFQYWFAKGGNHFVGIIISPYCQHNNSVVSDIRCLTIGQDMVKEFLCHAPYQFSYTVPYRDNLREILGPASELAEKYSTYPNRVALSSMYRSSQGITCLSKMLQSVKHHLEPQDARQCTAHSRRKVEDILRWLEQIFMEKFSESPSQCLQFPSDAVEIAPLEAEDPSLDGKVQI